MILYDAAGFEHDNYSSRDAANRKYLEMTSEEFEKERERAKSQHAVLNLEDLFNIFSWTATFTFRGDYPKWFKLEVFVLCFLICFTIHPLYIGASLVIIFIILLYINDKKRFNFMPFVISLLLGLLGYGIGYNLFFYTAGRLVYLYGIIGFIASFCINYFVLIKRRKDVTGK